MRAKNHSALHSAAGTVRGGVVLLFFFSATAGLDMQARWKATSEAVGSRGVKDCAARLMCSKTDLQENNKRPAKVPGVIPAH
jgi:hypothetical protein